MYYIRLQGLKIEVCKFKVTYRMDGIEEDIIIYTPYEEEADFYVTNFQGEKTPLGTLGYEWADGLYVEETTDPVKAAEELIKRGESDYLNSLTIPSELDSLVALANKIIPTLELDSGQKIAISGLYDGWTKEREQDYRIGEIVNANGQTWECVEGFDDKLLYPEAKPNTPGWNEHWKPLHGTSKETARDFIPAENPSWGYKRNEYMIYKEKLYKCIQDTTFTPDDFPLGWEVQE